MRTEPPPDEDAALALGQLKERRALGHPDMRTGGEFHAPSDHRTAQHAEDGHLAELDQVERPVPRLGHARIQDGMAAARGEHFGEVEPRAEVVAQAMQDRHPRLRRRPLEECDELVDELEVQRISLVRTVDAEDEHVTVSLDLEQGWRDMLVQATCRPGSERWIMTRSPR